MCVLHPPQSGLFTCAAAPSVCNGYVEVVLTQPVSTFFARVLGRNTMTVGVRAVVGGTPAANVPCVTTLKTGTLKGLDQTAGTITMPGCTVNVSANAAFTGVEFDVSSPNGDGSPVAGQQHA